MSVRQSDFEVFQALAKDSEDIVNSAQKEYSQDIPVDKPWGSGPPVLPPHLLQVILNKDTPISVTTATSAFPIDHWWCFLYIFAVWADLVAWTKSRNVESFVCVIDKGRRHGAQCDASISKKIRYNVAIQTNLGPVQFTRLADLMYGFWLLVFRWNCDCCEIVCLTFYFIQYLLMYPSDKICSTLPTSVVPRRN